MRIYEILLEYNESRLITTFGQKAVVRYIQEFPDQKSITPKEITDEIVKMDPSSTRKYSFWLIGNYARGGYAGPNAPRVGIQRWEDIASRAVPALKLFDKLVRTNKIPAENRNIDKLKSLPQLE